LEGLPDVQEDILDHESRIQDLEDANGEDLLSRIEDIESKLSDASSALS